MALWHENAWERSWGSALGMNRGEITSQRHRIALEGFIGLIQFKRAKGFKTQVFPVYNFNKQIFKSGTKLIFNGGQAVYQNDGEVVMDGFHTTFRCG